MIWILGIFLGFVLIIVGLVYLWWRWEHKHYFDEYAGYNDKLEEK